jgi:aldehyde:ferredoxin oxidoreductase
MLGNFGKMMRIDLSSCIYREDDIKERLFGKYIGGKGIATYFLLKEIKPKIDPLSSENKLFFATGPLTNTKVPTSGRYGVFTKSPLTGIYAESYSGGHVAPMMRRCGYDLFIIEGKSAEPIWLEVTKNNVAFHNASHLWGKDTFHTEDAIVKDTNIKGAQAVVIGPAGENLVRFACIENNKWRSAGRCGVGAVMGAKRLKGIVFYGDEAAPLADEDALKTLSQNLTRNALPTQGVKNYRNYGTPLLVDAINAVGAFPTRCWQDGMLETYEKINASAMHEKFSIKSTACFNCFIACGKLSRVKEGKHAGLTVEGPEFETIYAFGGLCMVDDISEIAHFNDLCDRLGMDTISAGNVIALAIEASRRSKISEKLDYNQPDTIARLLQDIATKQGLGEWLAEGTRRFSERVGLADLAVHVKGLEPAAYEPRYFPGMALSYAVSPRGACHLRTTFYKAELSGLSPIDRYDDKPALLVEWEDKMILMDSLILCRFMRDLLNIETIGLMIKHATGYEYTPAQLRSIANDVQTMARAFSVREGISRKDDHLPERLYREGIANGPSKGKKIDREKFEVMLDQYYSLRGWDRNGIPR